MLHFIHGRGRMWTWGWGPDGRPSMLHFIHIWVRRLRMQCVLGVDGGNSKTIAIVAALDGTILGAGRGGCGDIYNARPGTGSSSIVVAPLVGSEAGELITLHDGTLLDGLVPTQDSSAAAIANIEYAVMRALQ